MKVLALGGNMDQSKWKHRRPWVALLALFAALLAVYFEPTHCVRGWLHGEAFYDGRPTSYWRNLVADGLSIDWPNFPDFSWWERVRLRLGLGLDERSSLPLIRDRDADPVLRELADDPDPHIAAFARDILAAPRRGEDDTADYFLWLQLLKKHNMR